MFKMFPIIKGKQLPLPVLLLLLIAAVGAMAQTGSEELLKRVCSESAKSWTVVFTSPAQVRQLIEEAEVRGQCEPKYAESFRDLKALLEPEVLDDICTERMYQLIRAFHIKYIHFYLPETTRDELRSQRKLALIGSPVPESLRRFFILFAKQVSAACKQHLVTEMKKLQDGEHLLSSEDFAVIERYKRESQRLGFLHQLTSAGLSTFGYESSSSSFREVQIVDLLSARVEDELIDDGAKLYVQVRFDDRLKRIKAACEKRFMPVYMELWAPTVRLNNLGYEDHARTKLEDKELNEEIKMNRWFAIIQACEVLKDIVVLHDSTTMNALVGIIQDNSHFDDGVQSRLRDVKILSQAEAEALEQRVRDSDEGQIKPAYDPELVAVRHEPVKFTPRMWLTEEREVRKELKTFDSDMERLVTRRTSYIRQWRKEVGFQLRNLFHTQKNAFEDRDDAHTIGQLAAFFERHRVQITLISMCISLIFLTTALAG